MVASNTSPNPDNYYIGKGVVSMSTDNSVTWRDVGNVPEFEFSPTVEKRDHFSSRGGVRIKDKTFILEAGGTVRMVMEEFTAENLKYILMGDVAAVGDGSFNLGIMTVTELVAAVRFVGANDYGPRLTLNFPRVSFAPNGSLSLIGDEEGNIELEGDVQAVETNGVLSFGSGLWTPGRGWTPTPPGL